MTCQETALTKMCFYRGRTANVVVLVLGKLLAVVEPLQLTEEEVIDLHQSAIFPTQMRVHGMEFPRKERALKSSRALKQTSALGTRRYLNHQIFVRGNLKSKGIRAGEEVFVAMRVLGNHRIFPLFIPPKCLEVHRDNSL